MKISLLNSGDSYEDDITIRLISNYIPKIKLLISVDSNEEDLKLVFGRRPYNISIFRLNISSSYAKSKMYAQI